MLQDRVLTTAETYLTDLRAHFENQLQLVTKLERQLAVARKRRVLDESTWEQQGLAIQAGLDQLATDNAIIRGVLGGARRHLQRLWGSLQRTP